MGIDMNICSGREELPPQPPPGKVQDIMTTVALEGKGSIGETFGDQSIRWSTPTDYYLLPPNQVVDREVNAPMKFCLDNFNSTKVDGVCVLAPGDPSTAVHPLIAVGMVRKTPLDITETVTDVDWSEKKISHKYRTNVVSGLPCCMVYGYGGEMSVEEIGPNKTRLINKAYQDTRCCMAGSCCCCCLCWNSIGNSFLVKDVDALEAKWALPATQMHGPTKPID